MYGRSSARRRVGGSLSRRRGIVVPVRRSTLPDGNPLPCTASIKIRVISCERVRCSPAARRLNDSFSSFGTYAPINTPFLFAIIYCEFAPKAPPNHEVDTGGAFLLLCGIPISRILFRGSVSFRTRKCSDDHSSRPSVTERLKQPTRKRCRPRPTLGRAARSRFPIWSCTTRSLPGHRVSPPMPVSSYLTVSPITAEAAGLFSVALVVIRPFRRMPGRYPARCPMVFGLSSGAKAPATVRYAP